MKKVRPKEVKSLSTELVIGRAGLWIRVGLSLDPGHFSSPLLMILGKRGGGGDRDTLVFKKTIPRS